MTKIFSCQAVVAQTFNPSVQKAEAVSRISVSSRPTLSVLSSKDSQGYTEKLCLENPKRFKYLWVRHKCGIYLQWIQFRTHLTSPKGKGREKILLFCSVSPIALDGFECLAVLPPPPEHWNHRDRPSHPASGRGGLRQGFTL